MYCSYPRNWIRGCLVIVRWYSVLFVLSKTWGRCGHARIVVELHEVPNLDKEGP